MTMLASGGDAVVRTKALSPSKIAVALQCPLRYLLETEYAPAASIPESLSSCLGRAAHEAIHLFATKDVPPEAAQIRGQLGDDFLRFALETDMVRLILDALEVPHAITSLISMMDFIDKVRLTTLAARRAAANRGGRAVPADAKGPSNDQAVRRGRRLLGTEVPLSSEVFDLNGRADLVEREAHGVIRITDFKTGYIPSELPTLQNMIQVSAYALILSERMPEAGIIVRIVFANGEWERPFSRDLADQALHVLSTVSERLPRGVRLQSQALASPGNGCMHCRFRPSCSIYRGRIDSGEWSADIARPFDAWGEIEQVYHTSQRLIDICLRDATGKSVRIVNVPVQAMNGVEIGAHCEAFGLASREVGRGMAAPCNFFVANGGRPFQSAFSSYIDAGVHLG